MISYIRTILHQYSADLPSKEYKNRYEPVTLYGYNGYEKHHEGVFDKIVLSTKYNWRRSTDLAIYQIIYTKNFTSVPVTWPKNI